ncbi:twin-arginine translocation signal domain-containing protein [Streptomyces sp. NPDC007861]|uniref:twin-arginine translocation signal domain-containing protein n=1 Tax=Streptomyces sp. NPDC007861 TaxID=3154893 RepID=UPI0033C03314
MHPSRRTLLRATALTGAAVGLGLSTTTPAHAATAAPYVEPIRWQRLGRYRACDAAGQRVRKILADSTRYLIGPVFEKTYPQPAPDGLLELKGTDERAVRLPAMTALTSATALRLGVYDPRDLPAAEAGARTTALIRTLAARHKANSGTPGWGSNWQTALWAYYAGVAGWLLWEALTPAEREQLAAMIVWEADRLTSGNDVYVVGTSGNQLYMTRRDGTQVTPGDSKSEEDNWNAAVLALAAAMMPRHPQACRWRRRNVELLLAAAAGPADLTNPAVINGIRLSDWLQGTNINDDGTLNNHSRLHPLYMVAFDQSLYQGFTFGLAGQHAPRAALHNIDRIYAALVANKFPTADGSERTIYTPGSAQIYYPQGNDWGTHFPFYFGNFDLLVSVVGKDAGIAPKASIWEKLHNEDQLALQARFPDGRTYGAHGENTYYGREQRIGVMAGQAYLTLFLARNDRGPKLRWR